MKLIVGLGNPGKNYHNTRHNIGYMFLDEIARRENVKFKTDVKLKCDITELIIEKEKVLLIKPLTYMNLSGQSVYAVCKYYNINLDDILVIQDDLDLELGKLRFRSKGSSGGHKGIQNIIDQFGSNEFKRLKVGISKVESKDTIDYVLGKFGKAEMNVLNEFLDYSYEMIRDFCILNFENLMSRYNK